jgi:CRP-like cAMP-binding protein
MTDSSILEKAIDAIVVLNAAFTNIRLYPPTSAMIGKSIDSSDSILKDIFEQENSITFAESEKNLIIAGHGLDGKDNKRPQVVAFIQMMLKLGIKSITFDKGLEKSEILSFLEVVTKKPEDLRHEGGLQKVMLGKDIHHIHLDQKFYVPMDKGQRIVEAKNVKEPGVTPGKEQLLQIKAGIEGMIRGQDSTFTDKIVMQALPSAVLDLISKEKEKTVDAIINRLGEGMLNENPDVRGEASLALARIGAKLLSEKRLNDMFKLSPKFVEWIKFETLTPAAYKHITNQMRILSQYLILNRRLKEAMELLNPFYLICSGEVKKNESIKAISAEILKEVASGDVLNSLTNSLKSGQDKLAGYALELETILKGPVKKDKVAIPAEKGPGPPLNTVVNDLEKQPSIEDELAQQLKLADQLVQKKDIKAAVNMLFELVVNHAQKKDFDNAETLRDKMMEIAPMALNDIIRSGEIIEEEKSKAIDQAHLNLWADLYKTMTKEESSTLYFAMKSVKFDSGHTVFRKGDHDSKLYFINKGKIKLFVNHEGNEKFIKELKPGNMMGAETFFSLSLCTTSATTLTPAELSYLDKTVLEKWESKSYGIEPKLHDYFLKTKKTDDASEEKGHQLRVQERIAISGKVKVQFLDSAGVPLGESIIGALSDVSQGGLSFYLNIKKEKISKLFLHPRLNMKFSLKTGGSEHPIEQNGTMIAAVPHFYDFSIHVKFDSILDKRLIEGIEGSKSEGNGTFEIFMKS